MFLAINHFVLFSLFLGVWGGGWLRARGSCWAGPIKISAQASNCELGRTPLSAQLPRTRTHAHHTHTPRTMPPRIPISHVARCCRTSIERSNAPSRPTVPLSSLFAALSIQPPPTSLSQTRHASILSNLSDNKGAYNKRIRKGRGASSGYGKTSGRGHKGQGQHGKIKPWFQGGQTPLIIKHGRKGFTNLYVGLFEPITTISGSGDAG